MAEQCEQCDQQVSAAAADDADEEVCSLVEQRLAARSAGDYAAADAVRDLLFHQHAVTLEHAGDGEREAWRRWPSPPAAAAGHCHVWLRGHDGKPSHFCERDLPAAAAQQSYYCSQHAAENAGRVQQPSAGVPLLTSFPNFPGHASTAGLNKTERRRVPAELTSTG